MQLHPQVNNTSAFDCPAHPQKVWALQHPFLYHSAQATRSTYMYSLINNNTVYSRNTSAILLLLDRPLNEVYYIFLLK